MFRARLNSLKTSKTDKLRLFMNSENTGSGSSESSKGNRYSEEIKRRWRRRRRLTGAIATGGPSVRAGWF